MRRTVAIVAFTLTSLALFVYSLQSGAKFEWSEALGFITGALCVWMTVYENVWNFPIGVANSAFSVILFLKKGFYADFGLNILYIVLGLQGWYLWLYGGKTLSRNDETSAIEANPPVAYPRSAEMLSTELVVTRAEPRDWLQALVLVALSLPLLTIYLTKLNGTAPFMDSLLTSMSVAAQIMLNRKRLENWLIWIAADVMYVGLFAYKHLYLYTILYAVFCGLAVAGYLEWRRALTGAKAMTA